MPTDKTCRPFHTPDNRSRKTLVRVLTCPNVQKNTAFGDCIVQPGYKSATFTTNLAFCVFIQEYSIVLNLARKVQTLLHKMSFAGSTEDGLYWHVLCLNLENLSRGSRLTFCARFVALYFKISTIFSSGVRVQNNSTSLSKPLRSQTISVAPIHTVSALPHNL